MPSTRETDLNYMLRQSGVLVTLGGASTYGTVRLASAEESSAEGPIALQAQLVTITIATGSLPALAAGVSLTAAGILYRVHRHYLDSDRALTRIVAYPTAQAEAELWTEGAIVLPWAERAAAAPPSEPFDLGTVIGAPVLVLQAGVAAAGTDPELSLQIFDCATADGTFEDSGLTLGPLAEEGGTLALALDRSQLERFIQLVPLITGTDAPAFWCVAAILDLQLMS